MPFSRSTLQQLIDRAATDIESRLPGTDARLRRSVLNVLARMHAGAIHGVYGNLAWLARQIMPDTADAEILARWASIWKVPRIAAVSATGAVTLTGTDGIAVPVGTVLQRSDGASFATDTEVTIATSTATVSVTAETAGAAGNTAANTLLTFVSPIAGVSSTATVGAAGLAGGAETESDERLRARLLARIQSPPRGGTAEEYAQWARDAHADVTRVWVYPQELAPNGVTLRVMTDSATANGIPTQAVLDAVLAYIQARRPVTAQINVVAPVAVALDLTIALTPDTQDVRTAVVAELTDMLARQAVPGGTIYRSWIAEAISTASAEEHHILTVPAADVAYNTGEIAVLGTITWL